MKRLFIYFRHVTRSVMTWDEAWMCNYCNLNNASDRNSVALRRCCRVSGIQVLYFHRLENWPAGDLSIYNVYYLYVYLRNSWFLIRNRNVRAHGLGRRRIFNFRPIRNALCVTGSPVFGKATTTQSLLS